MRLHRGVLGVVMAIAVTSLVVVPPAESAPRTWSKMAVSWDGRTWSAHLAGPMFPPSLRLVPGGEAERSFFVRNQTPDRATLAVSAVISDPGHLLRAAGFRIDLRTPGKAWRSVRGPGASSVLRMRAHPGAVRTILVRVRLDPSAGNELMNRTLPFKIRLRMTSSAGR